MSAMASYEPIPLHPPAALLPWVGPVVEEASADGLLLQFRRGPACGMISVLAPGARARVGDAFADIVRQAYQALSDHMSADHVAPDRFIVRVWNGVPGIHDRQDAQRDRYMAFNAGRYLAMRDWYGDALPQRVPAASGVGVAGEAFVLHALLAAEPGASVENPNQRPAVRYSRQYGPLPPCFARATRATLGGRPRLLVSGTAAITGEASMHPDNLDAQLALTLGNLRTLVAAAGVASEDRALAAFESVRVYVPPAGEAARVESARIESARIESAVRSAFEAATAIEFTPAELCRRELLVEIEGVASDRPGG